MTVTLIDLLSIAAVAGVGAYLGAYLRKKGENRAIHEDIDRVVRATEELRSQISGDLWVRQKRWEFRREVYSALIEGLDEVVRSTTLYSVHTFNTDSSDPGWDEKHKELTERRAVAHRSLRKARALAGVFLPEPTVRILDDMERAQTGKLRFGEVFDLEEALSTESREARKAYDELIAAARRDLLDMEERRLK